MLQLIYYKKRFILFDSRSKLSQISLNYLTSFPHKHPESSNNFYNIFIPPWPRPVWGIEPSGCAYIRPSVAQVKIFVHSRISGTIDDEFEKAPLDL